MKTCEGIEHEHLACMPARQLFLKLAHLKCNVILLWLLLLVSVIQTLKVSFSSNIDFSSHRVAFKGKMCLSGEELLERVELGRCSLGASCSVVVVLPFEELMVEGGVFAAVVETVLLED